MLDRGLFPALKIDGGGYQTNAQLRLLFIGIQRKMRCC